MATHRTWGILALAFTLVLQALQSFAEEAYIPAPGAEQDPYCIDRIINVRPPRFPWYVRAEAVMLARDPEGDRPFAFQSTLANPVLSTNNLDFDFNAGPRLLIGHSLNECFQLEGSYFDVAEWQDEAAIRSATGSLVSPFVGFSTTAVANALNANSLAAVRSRSYLQNAELNLRQHVPMPPGRADVSFLFGLRYLRVDEGFEYASSSAAAVTSLSTYAKNDLIGPQIGMLAEFFSDHCWWINFEMKGALLNNSMSQSTTFSNTVLAPGGLAGRASENGTAFLGDISLDAVYRYSPRLSARFGYQAIWISGLALASENANTNINILTLGPAQLDDNGEVVYHGPHVGIEFGW